jgi:hypothetical protein
MVRGSSQHGALIERTPRFGLGMRSFCQGASNPMEQVEQDGKGERASDRQAFSDDLIARIAEVIGVSDRLKTNMLRVQLGVLCSNVELYKTRGLAGSATERILALEPVSKTCAAVLRAFDQDKKEIAAGLRRDVMMPQLVWCLALAMNSERAERVVISGGGDRKLKQILRNVKMLMAAADAAIARSETDKRPGRGGDRREHDHVLHDVTTDLFELYVQVTGRNLGTSVDSATQEATGPLVQFFALVLPELGWSMSKKAIRSHIERVRKRLPVSRDQFLKNFDPVILNEARLSSTSTADAANECGCGERSNEDPKQGT